MSVLFHALNKAAREYRDKAAHKAETRNSPALSIVPTPPPSRLIPSRATLEETAGLRGWKTATLLSSFAAMLACILALFALWVAIFRPPSSPAPAPAPAPNVAALNVSPTPVAVTPVPASVSVSASKDFPGIEIPYLDPSLLENPEEEAQATNEPSPKRSKKRIVIEAEPAASPQLSAAQKRAAAARKKMEAGNYRNAAIEWEKAVRLDPENGIYRLSLAIAYDRSGSYADALLAYKSVPEPMPREVERRLRWLEELVASGE